MRSTLRVLLLVAVGLALFIGVGLCTAVFLVDRDCDPGLGVGACQMPPDVAGGGDGQSHQIGQSSPRALALRKR
jgi:hypothetical protein